VALDVDVMWCQQHSDLGLRGREAPAEPSNAPRVRAARRRCSGVHHSAMAMLPCGAIDPKTSPIS